MNREKLIEKYVSNFNELGFKTQRSLLKELGVFSDSILNLLLKKKVYVIILPLNKKFTDIREYSHWKGKPFYIKGYGKHQFYKSFDDVRGWGGNPTIIGEEWVMAKDKNIFNVIRHEIAHQIHGNILPKETCDKIHRAYQKAKKDNYFIRKNSSINEGEYFADGVTFYFNRTRSKTIKVFDMDQLCNRQLLRKKDKILYDIIKSIF